MNPLRPKKILCCTDFSTNSLRALPYALSIARGSGAEVHLMHVAIHYSQGDAPRQWRVRLTLQIVLST